MKKSVSSIFVGLIFFYLLWIVRPAFLGQLTGTFESHPIPASYTKLASFLTSDKKFSRTLWIPTTERYGFFSFIHPFISSYDLFNTSSISATLSTLGKPNEEKILSEESIKYIIVPEDTGKEIFLKDRKYDNSQYVATIKAIQKISWLHELSGFGKVHIFSVNNTKNHFWVNNHAAKITYVTISPTKYTVKLQGVHKGDMLVFTDAYDSGWVLHTNSQQISSKLFNNTINSFVLPQSGDYQVIIQFKGQEWVVVGIWISGITLIVLLGLFVWSWIKAKT